MGASAEAAGDRARRRWFALVAAALPLLLLAVAEAGLRLAGVGYPTGFFLDRRVGSRPVVIENQDFSRRFFPPGLERTTEPLAMAKDKPPGLCRVFVLGESAAQGDPEPAFGCARILECLLRARHPDRQFEVVNVAVTAINSHVIRSIARDCAARQGDVWVIYMGNNEVIGPFGAGTVFGAQVPGAAWIRASLAFKTTRLGQVLDALKWRLAGSRAPTAWEGMEMFLHQQVRPGDPRLARVYTHFQANLEAILDTAERAGVGVVLSTVASNLKDCPPFASLHRPDLDRPGLNEWDRRFQNGTNREAAADFAAAVAAYQHAAQLDDQFAELWFRLGRCHAALTNTAAAADGFVRARDCDTLRFRADTRINQIITDAVRRRGGARLKGVDAAAAFAARSAGGVAGDELLLEHVHPNFAGHYLLACLVAEQVEALLAARDAPATAPVPWLSLDECRRRLAFTEWDRAQVLEELCERLAQPPFTHQLGHAARMQRWREEYRRAEEALNADGIDAAMAMYRDALERSPADWVLHADLARLAQASGNGRLAETQWQRVIELMPHVLEAYYSLGNLLDSRGETATAIPFFLEALRRRPDLVEARNGLGLALANLGRMEEAMRQYQAALQRKPTFAEAHVNLGQALARVGKLDEARAQYEAALRLKPGSAAAHINLGKLLAGEGRLPEAAAQYRLAVEANPANAIARYNLGNALVALKDPGARAEYLKAIELQPEFAEAQYNVGLGYAQEGRLAEAQAHLAEAVRLRPAWTEAHLALGTALARLGRSAEAIREFEETLRLDPGNAVARKHLDRLRGPK